MPAPSSTPTEPAVRLAGVAKTFAGGVRALDGVTFAAGPGELVALVGANGSGKSTLLKLVFGVLAPDAGEMRALGLDPRRDRAAFRAQAGFAGQEAALDPEMTGRETLRLFHALRGLPRHERDGCLAWAEKRFGLGAFWDRPVGTWSGGERQRLHLALETIHRQRLLLLDEPTTSLDPDGRRELWRGLAEWCAEGGTALVATHDLAEAAAHCRRVLVLHRGRVLADDSPAALVAAHARARATIVLAAGAGDAEALRDALAALPDAPDVTVEGATVTLLRDRHPDGHDPALDVLEARGIAWREYRREEPDLAGAYFRLTGSRPAAREAAGAGRGRGGRRG